MVYLIRTHTHGNAYGVNYPFGKRAVGDSLLLPSGIGETTYVLRDIIDIAFGRRGSKGILAVTLAGLTNNNTNETHDRTKTTEQRSSFW